jgi:RNA polymerase sigma factor (sigma-70 family)
VSGLTGPAEPDPLPQTLREDFWVMNWCADCGAVQWGARTCKACGEYQAARRGFKELYEAYADPLRRFVRRLATDRGLPESLVDAEDIVHDTFVVLLYGSHQPVLKPAAWLFTVARNRVSKAAEAQRRIAAGDPASHLNGDGAAWATLAPPSADAEDIRAAREVMDAIDRLPGHQRIATYLRQVQGWSLAEIGEYLNCAASTAGVHVSRGTAKVNSLVSPQITAPPGAYATLSTTRATSTVPAKVLLRRIRRRKAQRSATLAAAWVLLVGFLLGSLHHMPLWLAVIAAAVAAVPSQLI